MAKKGTILIIEDDDVSMKLLESQLKKAGYETICANTIKIANKAIVNSLENNETINLILLDLNLGLDFGGDFGRKVKNIIGDINIIVQTAYPDWSVMLTFTPDDTLVKSINGITLIEACTNLMKPQRQRINPSVKETLNRWVATQHLTGVESLKFHSHKLTEEKPTKQWVEKITSITNKGEFINTVIYANKEVARDDINIGLSSLLGCPGLCLFCKHHRTRKNKEGISVAFLRQLSSHEIIGQVYLALLSPRLEEVFVENSQKKLVLNFTCEGDAFVYNLDNCMLAIKQLSTIPSLEISFIITSIGSISALNRYIEKYIDLPGIRHYWSVNCLDEKVRSKLMPGTEKLGSLKEMRDAYLKIATRTKTPVTVSWIVIPNINNKLQDAEMIAKFFGDKFLEDGRPAFEIKLMPLVSKNLNENTELQNIKTAAADVVNFGNTLKELHIKIRKRPTMGVDINASCGQTIVEWSDQFQEPSHCSFDDLS